MTLEQSVVFAILMENGEGIIGKAPSYILEKLESCKIMEKPWKLLDEKNKVKFDNWKSLWLKEKEDG